MKMNTWSWRILGFGMSAALFSGCASTTMESVQRGPHFQSAQIQKVLVVGITQTAGLRPLFEAEFVRQWKARGVNAVASLDILPTDVTLDKVGIAPVAKAQGFDSVLVTRVLKRQAIQPQIAQTRDRLVSGMPPEDSKLTDYMHAVVASPEYGKESGIQYEVAVLSTHIYDVATEQPVWSGTTQTLLTGNIPKLVGPFIKVILKNIYQK
jgi:hypothetical protein